MTDDELGAARGLPAGQITRLRAAGITEEVILNMSEDALSRALLKLEYPDRPRLRLLHARLALLDDNGEIPPDALSKARQDLEESRADAAGQLRMAGVPVGPQVVPQELTPTAPVAGLSPDNTGWVALGPGNIGGRTRSILIDPTDPSRIFAGAVGGGVWLTTDGGAHWQALEDLMANIAVCSLAMSPTDPKTLYAGTGEGFGFGFNDALRGNGIFKSTDGGWAWTQLAETKDKLDFYLVNSLAISPDGTTVLAGTTTGIFRSTDGGQTWSKKLAASIGNLVFHPTDSARAVAGGTSGKAYFTADGGASWTTATAPAGVTVTGRIQVAYAVRSPSVVYASVTAQLSQIWKSTDGGKTYGKQRANVNFLGTQGFYDNAIWAGDPTNADLLVVGGIDLWKSTDGGDTLTQISNWAKAPSSAHADHHAIVPDPGYNGTTNRRVYFGNDGGVYKTDDLATVGNNPPDYTNGWISLNNGYAVTQFYSSAGNNDTGVVVGGTQDNGTLRYTPAAGFNGWNTVLGGDGGAVGSDPKDPDYYYGEYVYLQIFRNSDGGASTSGTGYICGRRWTGREWTWKPLPFTIPDAQNEKANFIAPFVLDPNAPNRILGGGLQLWRTNDAKTVTTNASGPRWASIKSSVNSYISAIVVGPGNSDLILVGHNDGQVYRTVEGTGDNPTWLRIDNKGATPINANRACLSLTIDPKNANVYYATFGGYQTGNVWKSTDAGKSWKDISGVLPRAPVRDIAVHPQDSDWIYAATEVGLFASEDGGRRWSPTNEGPASVAVADLAWMGNVLVAATHGRGIFSVDLTIHAQPMSVVVGDTGAKLYSVDAQTGTQTADVPALAAITSSALVEGSTLWVGDQAGKVYARDSKSLAQIWQKQLDGAIDATPQLYRPQRGGDLQLVVAAANGYLYAFKASDGSPQWRLNVLRLPSGTMKKAFSSFVMADWAYLATEAGVYAVNLVTLKVGWKDTSIRCEAPLLLAANQVFVPTPSGTVQTYDARTGAKLWSFTTGAASTAQPAWVLGAVVCGTSQGQVVGLDYRTGAQRFSLTKSGENIQSLTATGNRLYIIGNAIQANLYAYEVTPMNPGPWSLTPLWSTSLALGASRPGLTVGDTLYVTANNSQLQAYDTNTGSLRWTFGTRNTTPASPAAVFP